MPLSQTAWWMLDIFFGLDASGFDFSGQLALQGPSTPVSSDNFYDLCRPVSSGVWPARHGNLRMPE